MPDPNTLVQPDKGQPARTIHVIDAKGFDAWLAAQPPRHRTAAAAQKLVPSAYASAILPGDGAEDWSVVSVVANAERLSVWCLAKLAETLPEGTYRIEGVGRGKAIHGWLADQYKFDAYKKDETAPVGPRVLLTSEPARIEEAVRMANATYKLRDRINTGANDMGPADLEAAAPREQVVPVAERVLAAWLEANPKIPSRPGKGAAWSVGYAGQRELIAVNAPEFAPWSL